MEVLCLLLLATWWSDNCKWWMWGGPDYDDVTWWEAGTFRWCKCLNNLLRLVAEPEMSMYWGQCSICKCLNIRGFRLPLPCKNAFCFDCLALEDGTNRLRNILELWRSQVVKLLNISSLLRRGAMSATQEHSAFIFRVKESNCLILKVKATRTLQNARNDSPSDKWWHPKILKS